MNVGALPCSPAHLQCNSDHGLRALLFCRPAAVLARVRRERAQRCRGHRALQVRDSPSNRLIDLCVTHPGLVGCVTQHLQGLRRVRRVHARHVLEGRRHLLG